MEGFENEKEERTVGAQLHTQDKLCVCFPLAVCKCRLRWFTSAGDCSDYSAPCQCPGNNLALQGLMLESMKSADFIHTCILSYRLSPKKCCKYIGSGEHLA